MTNPYAPPQAVVQDIADPGIGFVLAERGTRLGAAILDTIIFAVMVYVPIFIAAFATGAMQAVNPEASSETPSMNGMEIVMLEHDSLGRSGHSVKARLARKLLAPLELRPVWRDGLVAVARKPHDR